MFEVSPEVIDGCRRRSEEAYSALFGVLELPVVNFLHRMCGERNLAEDLFQETFVRILRGLPSWQPRAKFSTWVFTIARNLALDHFKHERRGPGTSTDQAIHEEGGKIIFLSEMIPEEGPSPAALAERAEEVERLRDAIERLGVVKREALVLRVFQGLPYTEIAEITGCPVGTAKYRVHDAVQDLTRMLASNEAMEA
ncbi:MAG: sigma-70 family RNA polymerase sigma factor [Planctomycetota bacterium]